MLCETTFEVFSTYHDCCTTGTQQNGEKHGFFKIYVCFCGLCATCATITICWWDNFMLYCWSIPHLLMYLHTPGTSQNCMFFGNIYFFRKLEENSSILLMYGVLLGAWCATIKIVSKILPRGHVVYSYLILNP